MMKYQIVTFEDRCGDYVNRVHCYTATIKDARNHILTVLNRNVIDPRMIVKNLSNIETVVVGDGWKEKETYASWRKNKTGEYFLVVAIFTPANNRQKFGV